MEKAGYCQSCAMPMNVGDAYYGTNADGSENEDYCIYCFKDGDFTSDVTMEEMIVISIPHMISAHPELDEEAVRRQMEEYFPTLKRWSK